MSPRRGALAAERDRAEWAEWSVEDVRRKQLAAWDEWERRIATRAGSATSATEIAHLLGTRNAATAPDFRPMLTRDRWLFDRLVSKLPAWEWADLRLVRRRVVTVRAVLTTQEDREAFRELIEGYERVAFAYAAAGYLGGYEAGKLAGGLPVTSGDRAEVVRPCTRRSLALMPSGGGRE